MKLKDKIGSVGMGAAIAQQIPPVSPIPIVPGIISAETLFGRIVQWILFIGAFIAILFLIYGGILYLTAGGNPEAVTKAKTTIVNAVIGVVVIAIAFAIYFALSSLLESF